MTNRCVRRSVLFVVLLAALSVLTLGPALADEPLMTPAQPPASLDPNLEQLPVWLAGGQACYGGPGTGCSCSAICCYRCNGQPVWVPADVGSELACKQACQAHCGGFCPLI